MTTLAPCLYPEKSMARLFTNASWSFCPPVTLAKGALSNVEGNLDTSVKSLAGILPSRTWYWSTAVRALGFRDSSADRGFLAMSLEKASLEGAKMVTFWTVDSAEMTSGTVWRRPSSESAAYSP